jgi:hypothetical protein
MPYADKLLIRFRQCLINQQGSSCSFSGYWRSGLPALWDFIGDFKQAHHEIYYNLLIDAT